jgi:hypothetical protein
MHPVFKFGLVIVVLSVLTMFAIAAFFIFNGSSVNGTMLVLPAAGFIFGVALMVTDLGSYLRVED